MTTSLRGLASLAELHELRQHGVKALVAAHTQLAIVLPVPCMRLRVVEEAVLTTAPIVFPACFAPSSTRVSSVQPKVDNPILG
jgi:hypothetical protein